MASSLEKENENVPQEGGEIDGTQQEQEDPSNASALHLAPDEFPVIDAVPETAAAKVASELRQEAETQARADAQEATFQQAPEPDHSRDMPKTDNEGKPIVPPSPDELAAKQENAEPPTHTGVPADARRLAFCVFLNQRIARQTDIEVEDANHETWKAGLKNDDTAYIEHHPHRRRYVQAVSREGDLQQDLAEIGRRIVSFQNLMAKDPAEDLADRFAAAQQRQSELQAEMKSTKALILKGTGFKAYELTRTEALDGF